MYVYTGIEEKGNKNWFPYERTTHTYIYVKSRRDYLYTYTCISISFKKKLHTIHTLTHFHIQRIHMKWLPVCV